MAAHTLNIPSISASASLIETRRTSRHSSAFQPPVQTQDKFTSSFLGARLRAMSTKHVVLTRCQPPVMTVMMTLPLTKLIDGSEKKLKWSSRSIRAFTLGEQEARELKYPKNGTESILSGILVEGTSVAARYLRENGLTFYNVRDETVKLLGKSDFLYFSPFHPPLTEQAQKAIDWAIEQNRKSGGEGEITPVHLLLGVWAQKRSAGHMILKKLGFNDAKAKTIAKSMNKEFTLTFK